MEKPSIASALSCESPGPLLAQLLGRPAFRALTHAEASIRLAEATAAVAALGDAPVAAAADLDWWADGQVLEGVPKLLLSAALTHEDAHGLTVLKALISKLLPAVTGDVETYSVEARVMRRVFELAQAALYELLRLSPLCRNRLHALISSAFPSHMSPSDIRYSDFVANLLHLATSVAIDGFPDGEELSEEIWMLVLGRLLEADGELWGVPAEDPAAAESVAGTKHSRIRHRLDTSLNYIFILISESRDDPVANQRLMARLLNCLRRRVLGASRATRVPFIYFLLASQSTTNCSVLLEWLWRESGVGGGPKSGVEELSGLRRRQAAVSFLADLVARAAFIDKATTRKWLGRLGSWAIGYLGEQTSGLREGSLTHGSFYAVVHAIFFIIGFRHKDLLQTTDDVEFLRELELDRLVHSSPNPLKFCSLPVALTFVAVTRRYQLVWCRELVEQRGTVDLASSPFTAIFPFEPYDLPVSGAFFPQAPLYRLSGGLSASPFLLVDGEEEAAVPESQGPTEAPKPRRRNHSSRISFCDDADLMDVYGSFPGFKAALPITDQMDF